MGITTQRITLTYKSFTLRNVEKEGSWKNE
jgi:hypothetical protein